METPEVPFGVWLRTVRNQRRMSQAECAERGEMRPQTWNRLEKTFARPELPTIEAVAKALDLPISEVAEAAGYSVFTRPELDDMEIWAGRRFGRLFALLQPEVREQAANAVESLLALGSPKGQSAA